MTTVEIASDDILEKNRFFEDAEGFSPDGVRAGQNDEVTEKGNEKVKGGMTVEEGQTPRVDHVMRGSGQVERPDIVWEDKTFLHFKDLGIDAADDTGCC